MMFRSKISKQTPAERMKIYRLRKRSLTRTVCTVCLQSTGWEHRYGCPNRFSPSANTASELVQDTDILDNRGVQSDPPVSSIERRIPFWEKDYSSSRPLCIKQDMQYGFAHLGSVSFEKMRMLLFLLRRHHPDLPKDPRTLLRTPRESPCHTIPGGVYVHIGLQQGLEQAILSSGMMHLQSLTLSLNVDGLKLFGSSNRYLWPILASVWELSRQRPFVVGVFWGPSKPLDANAYLQETISELKTLLNTGLQLTTYSYMIPVRLAKIICDTPARAFVKQVKGHSGYFGCDRCIQRGHRIDRRMTFTILNAPLRTDNNFRRHTNQAHHIGISPFEELPIDMIRAFPLDYMHLVCLGVMRRMIDLWVHCPGRGSNRLPMSIRSKLNSSILALHSHIPIEFQRLCQPITDFGIWKATEFRQFLLYIGPVVLHDELPPPLYRNFMDLFISISILSHPMWSTKLCDYARKVLLVFVQDFRELYGDIEVVFNVHNLIHLADDVQAHGPLDSFSAFPFESFLGKLRKDVHGPRNPAAQVHRRLMERCAVGDEVDFDGLVSDDRSVTVSPPTGGVFFGNIYLSNSPPNNGIIIGAEPSIICGFHAGQLKIRKFTQVNNFFTSPLASRKLLIFRVSRLSEAIVTVPVSAVTSKCCLFPFLDEFVCIPLLHSYNKTA